MERRAAMCRLDGSHARTGVPMAGDWIKMETSLTEKPEVVALSSSLSVDRFSVVGRLHKLWSWFNHHTENGDAPGVTPAFLDSLVALDGFISALEKVGWIHVRNGKITMPKFDRHNSKSAKNRALHRETVKRSRDDAKVTKPSPEKRREEKSNKPPLSPKGEYHAAFEKWWSAYPRRTQKQNAYRAWKKVGKKLRSSGLSTHEAAEKLQRAAEEFAASPKGKGRYVPHPSTWLNGGCYDDDRAAWQDDGENTPPEPRKARLPTADELDRWNAHDGGAA